MIRFVNLTGQIYDEDTVIGYFDTVKDKFLEVDAAQVFSSLQDFKEWVGEDEPEWKEIDWERLEAITPKEFLNEQLG